MSWHHQVALSTLLLVACSSQQEVPNRTSRSADRPLDTAFLRERLEAFAHDSMSGRLAGAAGNFKATAYVEREFRRVGLEAAGQDGFFQIIPLVERSLDSSSTFTTKRGAVRVGADFLPVNLAQLDRVTAEIVFAGDLTDPARWIAEPAIAGRIALLSVPPTQRTFVPGRWLADRRFAAAAATAVVQLELFPPAEIAAAVRNPQRHLSSLEVLSASARRVPRFYLSRSAAEKLIGRELTTLTPGDTLGQASLDLRAQERPTPSPARNVIGILRGTDPALRGQFVVVGAHNDHIGTARVPVDHDSLRAFNSVMRPRGANDTSRVPGMDEATRIAAILDSLRNVRPPRLDSISNGAMDDGGGTVTLLALAEALRSARPRRSILFVSHTAEEGGLLGSAWFTVHPTVPREHIVAMVNLDSYGGDGRAPGSETSGGDYLQVVGTRRLSQAFGALVDSVNQARSRPLALDSSLDASGHPLEKYCRSDHANYARFGIPIAFFSTGFNRDYHQVTDEAEYTDFQYLARIGGFVGDVVLAIANRPEKLALDSTPRSAMAPCRQ